MPQIENCHSSRVIPDCRRSRTKVYANVFPMRVGQNQPAVSSEHKLVPAACVGTFKPQPFQTLNQFAT